jgi:transposase
MVQTALAENPFPGQVFVFRGKRGDLVKVLCYVCRAFSAYCLVRHIRWNNRLECKGTEE